MVADTFLDPIWWLVEDWRHRIYIKAFETVNATSLRIGDYEALTDAALDPYIAIRNAWVQHRNKLIAE
jgi:phospholipid-binding lipoprotein MlaA